MTNEMICENRDVETESGDQFVSVTQLWKSSNKTESVYIKVFYRYFVLGKDDLGRINYELLGLVTFTFDKKGDMRFDFDKKKWYIFESDNDNDNDIDDFDDDEADRIYYESTEFEKEVFDFWVNQVDAIKKRIKYEEKLNGC